MTDAIYRNTDDVIKMTAPAAVAAGDVLQLPDGRLGVYQGQKAAASGDTIALAVRGIFLLAKTASVCLLEGGEVFWDRSANKVNFEPAAGDFFAGTVVADAAAADTTVLVAINVRPNYDIDFNGAPDSRCLWTMGVTNGLGVTEATYAAPTILAFDAAAEAAMAALHPTSAWNKTPIADLGIVGFRVAIYDKGDNAALDINIGVANGTHATDFESVTEFVGLHFDGNDLAINAMSRDGTTTVASTDTTVVAVDDTEFEVWIDFRNIDDIQIYIDGVNVLPDSVFKMDAASGPVFPIVHLEKTSDDTPADVRVFRITSRTTDQAA